MGVSDMDTLDLKNDYAGGQPGADGTANNFHRQFYPGAESVRGRILGALLRGDRLTQQDTLRRFSDFRLAAQVEALRKSGWAIVTAMIDVGTRDAGRKTEVARYHLTDEAIQAEGEIGRQFAAQALAAELRRRGA